jgi:hypothetical protein
LIIDVHVPRKIIPERTISMPIVQAPRGRGPTLPIKPVRGFKPKINSGDLLTSPAKELKRLGNPLAQSSWLGAGHNSN